MKFCHDAHAQGDGFGGIDDGVVRETVGRAVSGQNYLWLVIDGAERIEALLALFPTRMWYGGDQDWFWMEMGFYVDHRHRKSRHAAHLFRAAEWWASVCGAPVILGLQPSTGFARKARLFGRHAKHIGAVFLVGDGRWTNQRRGDA